MKIKLLIISLILAICMSFSLVSCELIFGSGGVSGEQNDSHYDCENGDHIDVNEDDYCDACNKYVIVVVDFYVLNDLHGKFCDTNTQPGVDELATYLKLMSKKDDHSVFLSSGDMWQGTAESNLTKGNILTEWMNELDFVAMTLGNHEFDWGQEAIRKNKEIAEFPFLAINIYDRSTNTLVDYCTPSIMIERGDIKIGIIGAIGDCYSSISSDMVQDITFKVGNELTNLVKAESERLRSEGADIIIYSLHDGYGSSKGGTSMIGSSALSSYYNSVLSSGYVDLVFEGHSHQKYTLIDPSGVYHVQGGGENQGISHVEISVNSATGKNKVNEANVVLNSAYSALEDDNATEELESKYSDVINFAYAPLGTVSRTYADYEVEQYVAQLYLNAGLERWSKDYDIVLGGGFIRTRSPYNLSAGTKTYADILSLLPFDNRLVLCTVSGSKLKNKFINSTNSDYYIAMSEYGNSILSSIDNSGTYYIVVDTYTALYAPNGLKIEEFYDDDTFARDLFAEAVKNGEFEIKHENYTLTSIPDALAIGGGLGDNEATSDFYYIKGVVTGVPSNPYGNLYITDEKGNKIYVYGTYDLYGNRYDAMPDKPQDGDTVILYSTVYKYVYGSSVTIELKNAVVIEIE